MCAVRLKDRKSSGDMMLMLYLNETTDHMAMASSVYWHGHVLRGEDGHVLWREDGNVLRREGGHVLWSCIVEYSHFWKISVKLIMWTLCASKRRIGSQRTTKLQCCPT